MISKLHVTQYHLAQRMYQQSFNNNQNFLPHARHYLLLRPVAQTFEKRCISTTKQRLSECCCIQVQTRGAKVFFFAKGNKRSKKEINKISTVVFFIFSPLGTYKVERIWYTQCEMPVRMREAPNFVRPYSNTSSIFGRELSVIRELIYINPPHSRDSTTILTFLLGKI